MPVVIMRESQLDSAVDSFESTQNKNGCADLANYLPDQNHPDYCDILVELIRVDLEYGWQRGTPSSIDEYLCRFPVLFDHVEKIEAICFEEYRQKLQAGLCVESTDYQERYKISTGHWQSSSRSLVGGHSENVGLSTSAYQPVAFPIPGGSIAGFRIIRELGRGAFARVYLAHQAELSERPVVLKLATHRFSDAKTLAKLQHTNIVPIYSVHHWGNSEAVCMPYFGAQTFQDLLHAVRLHPTIPPSGQIVIDTVVSNQYKTRNDSDSSIIHHDSMETVGNQNCKKGKYLNLSQLTYVESVLSLGKKVVDGLIHAHERGIVHRDLKPANILLSDDGEPMLLDFNLSEDQSSKGFSPKEQPNGEFIGGTLPYMAPEQLRAFQSKKSCSDVRCDLFSFGIILYELLTGRLPYPLRYGTLGSVLTMSIQDRLLHPPGLQYLSAGVTPAVEAIVLKLLAPSPDDRYQSALELREDLDRQINHLPLKHVKEPSWKERGKKWMVRHPRLVSVSGLGVIFCCILLSMASVLWMRAEHMAKLQVGVTWSKFQENLKDAQVKIVDSSLSDKDSLEDALKACKTALANFGLERDAFDDVTGGWQHLAANNQVTLRQDAAELHFLSATVQGIQADFEGELEDRKKKIQAALISNRRAIEWYNGVDTPESFTYQTEWLKNQLDNRLSDRLEGKFVSVNLDSRSLENVRDLCRSACLLTSQRRFHEASTLWQLASMKSPENIWVLYGLGNSLEQIGETDRAAECYSACVALNSQNSSWYFHRGRMRIKNGHYLLAKEDFLHSLKLKPAQQEAFVNLAIAEFELKEFSATVRSMHQAIELGYGDTQGFLVLANAYSRLGNLEQEKIVLSQIELNIPQSTSSWIARAVAKSQARPQEALDDLNNALALNIHLAAAHESKAYILAEQLGRTEEAIDVLSEAANFFPEAGGIRAARGVLNARMGHYLEAREDANVALKIDQSPVILYQVAGIHALLGKEFQDDIDRAVELLSMSIRHGYGADLLEKDPDLDPIRKDLAFQALRDAVNIIGSP